MGNFPWHEQFNLSMDTNWQVKTFIEIFLNIMSNYRPNETKRFVPRDPPRITDKTNKLIKTMLNRENRLFKNYKKHNYNDDNKVRLDAFCTECHKAVEIAILTYVHNIGNKVNDPSTCQKVYWKIINRLMNKCRAPKIPPLLVNNMFILNCSDKAKLFNYFFAKQCMPIITSSVLPPLNSLTDKKLTIYLYSVKKYSQFVT